MRNYLLILSLFVFYTLCGQDAGIYQTYVILDNGTTTYFHGGINNGGTTPYSNHSFGNVTQLALKGGEIKSWKNNGGDVTGAKLYFRVYVSNPIPDPLPNFTELDLPWAENNVDNSEGNQKWAKTDNNTNVLAGLTASETYNLEVYWKIHSNVGDKLDDNSGEYFKSTFTVDPSLSEEFIQQNRTISVMPNEIYFNRTGTFEISIFNILGTQVKHFKNTFTKGHILPLNFNRGVYILQVEENNHLNNYKMLVY